MINLKQEIVNYTSINISSLAVNESDIPDNIKNSIILYNKALESLRLDSEDIAIIELKKAIAMNPNFHEAMNLLGICYSHIKDYNKAAEIFEKVIAAENNSIKALRYLGLLNSNETTAKVIDNKKNKQGRDNAHSEKVKKSLSILDDVVNLKRNWKTDIGKYLIGFFLCALIVLVVAFIKYKPDDGYTGYSSNQPSTNITTVRTEDNNAENDISNNDKELVKVQGELKNAVAQLDYYKNTMKLYDIEAFKTAKDYVSAADMLIILKGVSFKEPEKGRFNTLLDFIIPRAADKLRNEAYSLMKTKKYQEAIDKFTKIQIYGYNLPYMDSIYYNLGKSYMGINDTKSALNTFTKIGELYPNSRYKKFSEGKIKELTKTSLP